MVLILQQASPGPRGSGRVSGEHTEVSRPLEMRVENRHSIISAAFCGASHRSCPDSRWKNEICLVMGGKVKLQRGVDTGREGECTGNSIIFPLHPEPEDPTGRKRSTLHGRLQQVA